MYKLTLCISRALFSRPKNRVLGNTLCISRPPFLKFNEVRTQEINDFFYVCIKSWTWNFKNFPTQKWNNVNSCALVNFKSLEKNFLQSTCNAEVWGKNPIGQSEQPILTAFCLCSLSREVNKLKSRMFQRNVHIVSELLWEWFLQTIMFKKLKRMHYDAVFKLKVIDFAKWMNNSSATREFGVVWEWQKAEVMFSEMPKTKCANRGKTCKWPELKKPWQNGWISSDHLGLLLQDRRFNSRHKNGLKNIVSWALISKLQGVVYLVYADTWSCSSKTSMDFKL